MLTTDKEYSVLIHSNIKFTTLHVKCRISPISVSDKMIVKDLM